MSDDGNDRSPFTELVKDARDRVYLARSQYYRDKIDFGRVREETRRELAHAAMQYRSALHEYADEGAIEGEWDESGIEWLDEMLHQQRPVESPAPGDTANGTVEMRPAILTVKPEAILRVTEKLDEIAKGLGFSATIKESTPRTEITKEDMEEVDRWVEANLQ